MFQIKEKINKIEPKLMNCQPEDLQNNIKALTKKTEQNKEMARDAQEAAESALNTTSDTEAVSLNKTTDRVSAVLLL